MNSSFPSQKHTFGISLMRSRTSCRAHGFTDATLAEKDGQPPGAHEIQVGFYNVSSDRVYNNTRILLGEHCSKLRIAVTKVPYTFGKAQFLFKLSEQTL